MTRDRNDVEELAHDSAGVNVEPFLERALADVVEELMSGEKVAGLAWGLQDCLAHYFDLPGHVSAAIVTGDFIALKAAIERHVRLELEGSDVVTDRAYELATEGEE